MGAIIRSRLVILLLFITIILSCDADRSIVGIYKSEGLTRIEYAGFWIKERVKGSISGQELILKSDSSYVYKTCGHIIEGNWTTLKKTLVLTQTSKRWKNDSLNNINYPFSKDLQGFFDFEAKGDEVVSVFTNGIDGRKLINKLSKQQ